MNSRNIQIDKLRQHIQDLKDLLTESQSERNSLEAENLKLKFELEQLQSVKERTNNFRELLFEFVTEGREI